MPNIGNMRRGLTFIFAALGLVACGGNDVSEQDTGETGNGDELGPSYAECTLNGDWGCSGSECAADPDAVHWLELIQAEIDARGWTEQLFVVNAETYPDTNQVLVSVVQDVGWFRAWAPINGLKTDISDDEFRQSVSDVFDAWAPIPTTLMPYEDVLAAFAECHPELVYDPCESNSFGFAVWDAVVYEPEPNCEEHLHTISIDLGSGEVVCETDLDPVGCG